jgi:hypothetical protein
MDMKTSETALHAFISPKNNIKIRPSGEGLGENGSVGDGSVRNGSVATKVAADLPPFNWFPTILY